jgi:hypothetical protein
MTFSPGTKGFSSLQRSKRPRGEPLVPDCGITGTKEGATGTIDRFSTSAG